MLLDILWSPRCGWCFCVPSPQNRACLVYLYFYVVKLVQLGQSQPCWFVGLEAGVVFFLFVFFVFSVVDVAFVFAIVVVLAAVDEVPHLFKLQSHCCLTQVSTTPGCSNSCQQHSTTKIRNRYIWIPTYQTHCEAGFSVHFSLGIFPTSPSSALPKVVDVTALPALFHDAGSKTTRFAGCHGCSSGDKSGGGSWLLGFFQICICI